MRLLNLICHLKRKQRLTFDEFKRQQNGIDDDPNKADEGTPTVGTKIEAVTIQQHCDQTTDVAAKLFATTCQSKRKLRRNEPIVGPLYIDPHLKEKVKNPRKCKSHFPDSCDGVFRQIDVNFVSFDLLPVNSRSKYYTNLFKSKFGLRKRVQVNGENFAHGKLGVEHDENFPRLPTEWDDYYVHEMRYRRSTAKFCVKT